MDTIVKKIQILYVEDDVNLAFVTKDNLSKIGYQVDLCQDGLEAIQNIQSQRYDLCILDVMLPKVDGFTLLEKIREKDKNVPIIMLTAKSMVEDKLKGLKKGADDYLTKPFSIEELQMKIEIFLKRSKVFDNKKESKDIFNIGSYIFNFRELNLYDENESHQLTLREAELLRMLCFNKNKVIKRDDILRQVWGEDDYYIGRSLDVFISRLRKFFQNDKNIIIENVRSVGFKFHVPGEMEDISDEEPTV